MSGLDWARTVGILCFKVTDSLPYLLLRFRSSKITRTVKAQKELRRFHRIRISLGNVKPTTKEELLASVG